MTTPVGNGAGLWTTTPERKSSGAGPFAVDPLTVSGEKRMELSSGAVPHPVFRPLGHNTFSSIARRQHDQAGNHYAKESG